MMLKKIQIFLLIVFLLIPSITVFAKDYNNIFLIDVSKSMIGYGDGRGHNVFPQVKNAIEVYLSELSPGSEITIIPFAETTRKQHKFNIDGSGKAQKFIQQLNADGSNTNIYGTLYRTLESTSSITEEPGAVYLFTDGNDNVHEKNVMDVINKYKSTKLNNPFVWIFYNDLSHQKDNPDLEKLRDNGVLVNELDRNISPQQLQNQLEKIMEAGKELIDKQVAQIKKERQELQDERQKVQNERSELQSRENKLDKRQAEIQEKLKNLSEKETKTRAKLNSELQEIKNRREEIKTLKADLLRKEKELEATKAKLQAERKKIEEAARQREEIKQLLQLAEKLVSRSAGIEKEAAVSNLKEAIDKYKAVLEKEPDNVSALAGLEKAKKLLWQRKNLFEKFWYLIIPGILALMFFALVVRRPFMRWWTIEPMRLNLGYNPQGNHLPPSETFTRSFLRQHFRKKGDTYYISKTEVDGFPVDHEAVLPVRHAQIYRKGKHLFIEPLNGQVLNEHKQTSTSALKIGQEENILLTHDQAKGFLKITLTQK